MQGKNDLFAIVIVFKTMLNDCSFAKFYNAFDTLMKDLSLQLHTIPISSVEHAMGFISSWRNLHP